MIKSINMELQDKLKLVAEYMGFEYFGWNDPNHRAIEWRQGYWGNKNAPVHHLKVTRSMIVGKLQYHTSWDWQIPVWAKLNERDFFDNVITDEEWNKYNGAVCTNDTMTALDIIVSIIQRIKP